MNKKKEYILYKINPNNGSRIKRNRKKGETFYNTAKHPFTHCNLCVGCRGGVGMVVMGEIRWKLKVMFLNNDTLNTIEAQYGSKTEDIIHQFELFSLHNSKHSKERDSDCHSVNSPPSTLVLKSAFLCVY